MKKGIGILILLFLAGVLYKIAVNPPLKGATAVPLYEATKMPGLYYVPTQDRERYPVALQQLLNGHPDAQCRFMGIANDGTGTVIGSFILCEKLFHQPASCPNGAVEAQDITTE